MPSEQTSIELSRVSHADAIWWHVYPLGFCGAPIRDPHGEPRPRLRKLIDWLDYASELGVTGLLLGPIFASETHGYDTVDHHRIDPRLGTEADFEALARACHDRGLSLVLDGVFSHVSSTHPLVRRALSEDPAADLIDIDWNAQDGPAPRVFEGHDSLVRLNHAQPSTADFVTDIMRHWLERGADGWRLDAAYSVPTEFWAEVLTRVRHDHPHAWFLGEVIHGDYAGFVDHSTVDTVTQYELWKAIWSSIQDRNMFELDWALQRHDQFLRTFTPQTFVGNHDVTRIASRVGPEGALVALAVLLTVGGTPSVYYGDEHAFTGLKEERLGGDDAVRPAFPDSPDLLAPWGAHVHRAHRELLALRRDNPWLTTASTEALALENAQFSYRVTARNGDMSLDVHLELSDVPTAVIQDARGSELWRTRDAARP